MWGVRIWRGPDAQVNSTLKNPPDQSKRPLDPRLPGTLVDLNQTQKLGAEKNRTAPIQNTPPIRGGEGLVLSGSVNESNPTVGRRGEDNSVCLNV
jgi:hypothetical protein